MTLERTVKSGKPFVPVSDSFHLAIGDAAGSGVGQTETWGLFHKTTLPIANLVVTMTDTGGANGGQGSQKVYDFPEGAILVVAAGFNLTIQRGSTGLTATAAVVASVGTVAPGADATLTGTEANMIPSTVATLSSGAGAAKNFSAAPAAPLDGTSTAIDALLNFAVPDAGISANDTLIVNGTITIFWMDVIDY